MPLPIGSRLGSFVIEASIGAGGMGEVYRARDSKLGRNVAIKVLPDLVPMLPDDRDRRCADAAHYADSQLEGSIAALSSIFINAQQLIKLVSRVHLDRRAPGHRVEKRALRSALRPVQLRDLRGSHLRARFRSSRVTRVLGRRDRDAGD
jgi:hypothetical protein